MVEMTRTASLSPLGTEFNEFLFAPIGEDRNGMLVSVLSALARHDIDPWEKAAELALLPRETGTQKLASLIAALPEGPSPHRDPGTVAARLIALLPHPVTRNVASGEALPGISAVTNDGGIKFMILIVFMLVAQWLIIGDQLPAQVDNPDASASGTVSSQKPPPNSGQ